MKKEPSYNTGEYVSFTGRRVSFNKPLLGKIILANPDVMKTIEKSKDSIVVELLRNNSTRIPQFPLIINKNQIIKKLSISEVLVQNL